MNIFEKMCKATEKIEKVYKNLKIEINSKRSYKAVSEADVLEAVKPIESELGIYSYPIEREVIETDVLVTTKNYNGEVSESKQLFMRLKVTYRFVNVEKPEEYIDITTFGDGIDSGDKAPGKAMTYADKYALLKAYKIETGDDPDKEASNDLKSKQGKVEYQNQPKGNLSEAQIKRLYALAKKANVSGDQISKTLFADYKKTNPEELTKIEYDAVCERLEKKASVPNV